MDNSVLDLINYAKNVFSQNGEDGIIEEILRRLKIDTGFFIEFGAWDGVIYSNTYNLLKNKGWCGMDIECNHIKYMDLEKLKIQHPNLITVRDYVMPDGELSLDNHIKNNCPDKEIDLLSIDVDGIDYQIWEGSNCNAKIVIIETNTNIHPQIEYIHGCGDESGSSFLSILKLGMIKGYELVCNTGNCIFVRGDLLNGFSIPEPISLFVSTQEVFNNYKKLWP